MDSSQRSLCCRLPGAGVWCTLVELHVLLINVAEIHWKTLRGQEESDKITFGWTAMLAVTSECCRALPCKHYILSSEFAFLNSKTLKPKIQIITFTIITFFHYFSEAPGLAVTLTLKMKSFRVSKTDICVC